MRLVCLVLGVVCLWLYLWPPNFILALSFQAVDQLSNAQIICWLRKDPIVLQTGLRTYRVSGFSCSFGRGKLDFSS